MVKSKLVKLENSRRVIFRPMVSVLCFLSLSFIFCRYHLNMIDWSSTEADRRQTLHATNVVTILMKKNDFWTKLFQCDNNTLTPRMCVRVLYLIVNKCAAIAQCLPSCHPRFDSLACHLCFHHLIVLYLSMRYEKWTKINKMSVQEYETKSNFNWEVVVAQLAEWSFPTPQFESSHWCFLYWSFLRCQL